MKSKPSLNYYPSELSSPNVIISDGCNGALIVASTFLVILLILVVVGACIYYSQGANAVVIQKKVSFGDTKVSSSGKLEECPDNILVEIMAGKYHPVVIAIVSPSCGHCVQMKPALQGAAKISALQIYTLTYISEEKTPQVSKVAQHLKVSGFPILFRVEGGKAHEYKGNRSAESIAEFAS